MRRNIEPDYKFEKEKFVEVLQKALEGRSYSAFAREADVSFPYISKYMNLKCDSAPTIATIKKLSSATKMVTYEELLQAAGYDPLKFVCEEEEGFLSGSAKSGAFMSFFNSVFTAVTKADFNWRFSRVDNNGVNPFSVQIEGAPFKEWFFIPVYKQDVTQKDIVSALSGTENFSIEPGNKISFMTSSKDIYNTLKKMEFVLFSLYISVMLVDSKTGIIEEEVYLKTSKEITDEDKEKYSILINNDETIVSFYSI